MEERSRRRRDGTNSGELLVVCFIRTLLSSPSPFRAMSGVAKEFQVLSDLETHALEELTIDEHKRLSDETITQAASAMAKDVKGDIQAVTQRVVAAATTTTNDNDTGVVATIVRVEKSLVDKLHQLLVVAVGITTLVLTILMFMNQASQLIKGGASGGSPTTNTTSAVLVLTEQAASPVLVIPVHLMLDEGVYTFAIKHASDVYVKDPQALRVLEDARALQFAEKMTIEFQNAMNVVHASWKADTSLQSLDLPVVQIQLASHELIRDGQGSGNASAAAAAALRPKYDSRTRIIDTIQMLLDTADFIATRHTPPPSSSSPGIYTVRITTSPVVDPEAPSGVPAGEFTFASGASFTCSACGPKAVTVVYYDDGQWWPAGLTGSILAHEFLHTMCVAHDGDANAMSRRAGGVSATRIKARRFGSIHQVVVPVSSFGEPIDDRRRLATQGGLSSSSASCPSQGFLMSPMMDYVYPPASSCSARQFADFLAFPGSPAPRCLKTADNATYEFTPDTNNVPPKTYHIPGGGRFASSDDSGDEDPSSIFIKMLVIALVAGNLFE